MRFHCDSCGRGYSVSDDLRGRAFKMTCRGCGRPIAIRPTSPASLASPVPDRNPFLSAPVALEPPPAPAAATPRLSAVGRSPVEVAPRVQAPALAPVAERVLMDAEDMRLALSEFFDKPGSGPAESSLDDDLLDLAIGDAPRRRRAAARSLGLARADAVFAWPGTGRGDVAAADLFATATKPSAGPRIALALAAAAVVAIVAAVLVVPRGGAPARRAPDRPPPTAEAVAAAGAGPLAPPSAPPAQVASPPADVAPPPAQAGPSAAAAEPGPPPVARASPPEAAPPAPAPRDRETRPVRRPAALARAGAAAEVASGPPASAQLARVLSLNRAGFDRCVSEAASREGAPEVRGGKVNLLATVAPTGAVTDPVLDDQDLDRTDLGACLRGVARKMTVPAFEGDPVRVEVPVSLSSGR